MGVVAEDDDFFEEDEPIATVLAAYDSGRPVTTVFAPPARIENVILEPMPDGFVLLTGDHVAGVKVSGNRTEARGVVVPC
jgi:hypothetical protein